MNLRSKAITIIYTFRYNYGWLYFLIGYIVGGLAMLYVLESRGYIDI